MISILAALVFFTLIGWIAVKKRFLIYILAFQLITFSWRLICAVYMDVAGPLYSTQLEQQIGGGASAVPLVGAWFATIVPILLVFRESKLRHLRVLGERASAPQTVAHGDRMAGFFFILAVGYIGALYLEFGFTGVNPLTSGMERWEYSEDYGGIFHQALMKYGNLFAFLLGLFYSPPTGQPRRRFLLLALALFLYLFLTGHRFSMFYSSAAFFIMPLGISRILKNDQAPEANRLPVERRTWGWKTIVLLLAPLLLMAGLSVYRSYTSIRTSDPGRGWEMFEERVLVQQGELWTSSYERVFEHNDYDPAWAFRRVFVEPLRADKSSTIPFLMELDLGSKVMATLEYGAYSGGYPEIFFEFFGPVFGYVAIVFVATLIALQFRWFAANVLQHRYLGTFFSIYVLYAFVLLMASGMLNFLTNWTFWVRVGGLLGTLLIYPQCMPFRPGPGEGTSSSLAREPIPPGPTS